MDHDEDQHDLTAGGPPPGSLSFVLPGPAPEWLAAEMAAAHAPFSGSHRHAHPAYGASGGDQTHEHIHSHSGDANHGHHGSTADAWTAAGAPDLAAVLAAAHAGAPEGGSLVAAAMEALGSPWGIEERGDDWALLSRDGDAGTFGTRAEAMAELATRAFADQGSRPVLAESWRSEMCFEGQTTPDGRYMEPGCLQYRDCPLPLMLQTTTDIGHFGAVLAGAILTAATNQGVALGTGEFDDTEAGRQFLSIVQARGRFGVSIDGTYPADAEFECTERDEDGYCTEGRVVFHLLTIAGLTGTPFPAFPDAYLALEQRAATAAGEHHGAEGEPRGEADTPCEDCAEPPTVVSDEPMSAAARARATTIPVGRAETFPAGRAATDDLTAAGAFPNLAEPPRDWFTDPGFAVDDGRVVLQPDGRHHACPLTVTADGEVFGHIASWFTCHTGYASQCVTAPRSKTGYAAFMLRPLMCADGSTVQVGHLSMGCGHAPTDRPLSADAVRAHYDGGPGAVRVAQVAVGEDAFGIWMHGSVDPAATEEQVREFAACSVSGDWREVWRGRGLDLVACLAGVTVPGFPVASALAAAGLQVVERSDALPRDPVARFTDGRPSVLVAAGVVRRPLPWEAMVAALCQRVDALEAGLADTRMVTDELRPEAAAKLLASIEQPVPASNGAH